MRGPVVRPDEPSPLAQLVAGGNLRLDPADYPKTIERLRLLSQPTSSHIVQLDNLLDLSAGFLLPLVGLDANQ